MKRLGFVLFGAVALALSACGRNDADTLNEMDTNASTEELNALANNAAAEAEMEALGNQEQQLEAENAAAADEPAPPPDNATSPSEVEDNVQGM